eukprot:15457-Eustigmatos_ZCMA.PRE.1
MASSGVYAGGEAGGRANDQGRRQRGQCRGCEIGRAGRALHTVLSCLGYDFGGAGQVCGALAGRVDQEPPTK